MNKLFTAIAIVLIGLGYQATAGQVAAEGAYAKDTLMLSMEEGKEVTAKEGESKAAEGVTESKTAEEGKTTEEATEGEATEGKEGEATEGKEGEATEGKEGEATDGVEDTDESSDEGDEEVEG